MGDSIEMLGAGNLKKLPSIAEGHPKLVLAIVVLAGLAVTAALQARPAPAHKLELTPVVEAVLRDRGTPRAGAANADVVIVVFTDYRCPICSRTDPALERLLETDRGVRVQFKDWPILGEQSRLGARAALAAERQGKYLPMHRALMAERGPLTAQRIGAIADGAGLDGARLMADLADHAEDIDEQLARHASQAFALGLRGTPSYLVGPYLIHGGLDERKLAQAVAAARKAGPPRTRQPE